MRKIGLLVLWIFLILMSIEISLRLFGGIYYAIRARTFIKKDSHKFRILCLGESTTFGTGALPGEDFPAQLNKLLEAKYANQYIVYNRGVPGISSSQILFNLRRFISETDPHLVILTCASNDQCYRLNTANTLLISDNSKAPVKYFLFYISRFLWKFRVYRLAVLIKSSMLYRFKEFCGAYINTGPEYCRYKYYEGEAAEFRYLQYKFNMKAITQSIRSEGREIVFTTYLHPACILFFREVSRENEVILCDQVEMLRQRNMSLDPFFSDDGFHLNAKGYGVMAEFLLETLEKNRLIGK